MRGFEQTVSAVWRAFIGLGLVLVIATHAAAQTTEETNKDKAEAWRFKLAPLYLWFSGMEGDAGIGPATAPVDITFSDVLSNLESVFTFHFEAGKKEWTFFADSMFLDIGPKATLPNGASINVTVENNIAEVGGTYRLREAAPWVEVLGGCATRICV